MKKQLSLAAGVLAVLGALGVMQAIAWAQEAEGAKPKHTIEEVMEKAHKGGLLKKVAGGEASADEKSELLDLYVSLNENEPPRGDSESFHKLASEAVMAAARVVVGRDGAEKQLTASVKCAACHKDHKPPAE